jgi:hypothetical protein
MPRLPYLLSLMILISACADDILAGQDQAITSSQIVKLPPAKPGAYQWGASKALANHEPPKGGYTPNFIWS